MAVLIINSLFGLRLKRTPRSKIDNDKVYLLPSREFDGETKTACSASYAETAGRASAVRFEPSAALTKLFPISHIGPGILRHSVSTSSRAFTEHVDFFFANDKRR